MEKEIKKILRELYSIDSTLRKHEKEVRAIVKELVALRPDSGFSEEFRERLKNEIFARTRAMSAMKGSETRHTKTFPRVSVFAGGAVVVAVFGLFFIFSGSMLGSRVAIFGEQDIFISQKDEAFGTLSGTTNSNQKDGVLESMTPQATGVMGMGGGGIARTMKGAPSAIAPYGVNAISFSYGGKSFSIPEKMLVFKKVRDVQTSGDISKLLKSFDFGVIDINAFKDISLNSFSIKESRPYGYSIDVVPSQGGVSISQNWDEWPHPTEQLSVRDMPKDSDVLAITNSFMKTYGISLHRYGSPEIQNEWQNARMFGEISYIPESVSVLYPLTLEERFVYDESGGKMGMAVSVDVRAKRVSGVWGINIERYETSLYSMETDTNKIITYAESGGRYGSFGIESQKLTLETPEFAYTIIRNQDGIEATEEIYVPALIFHIRGGEEVMHRQPIVVPLIKNINE